MEFQGSRQYQSMEVLCYPGHGLSLALAKMDRTMQAVAKPPEILEPFWFKGAILMGVRWTIIMDVVKTD